MSLTDLAQKHQQKRSELAALVGRRAARLWRTIQAGEIDAGWDRIAPQLQRVVTEGQFQAARMAQRYAEASARAQDVRGESERIVPGAFTGATLEGREAVPELYAAATTTKTLIGRGAGVPAAFQAGTAVMSMLAATMVRDAGNMADKVSAMRPVRTVKFARLVSPGACSRCAILAGVGHFTKHFERHPNCRCTTVPVYSDDDRMPDGLYGSAAEYFESLSDAEQDRVFTKSGAEAIRLGADPTSVVNARRGMYRTQQPGALVARATRRTIIGPDGAPFDAFTTSEGTSVRGWFGAGRGYSRPGAEYVRRSGDRYRRTTTVRLMPETILERASSPAEAVDLLKQFGYMR